MKGLCECGCGQRTKLANKTDRAIGWVRGEPIRFVVGHNPKKERTLPVEVVCNHCGVTFQTMKRTQRYCSRTCNGRASAPKGTDHHSYNYGWCYSQGRLMVICRDRSQVAWYRIVMQDKIGRPLEPHEVVHHINGDHTDDRLENLELLTHSTHVEKHRDKINARRWPKAQAAA